MREGAKSTEYREKAWAVVIMTGSLDWLRQHIKHWSKPATQVLLSGS